MRLSIIINPISGTGGRPEIARQRAGMAAAFMDARHLDGDVALTEAPGHARELARAAVGRGVDLVVAWGGDGTMNDVASALAFTSTPLALVPAGSGNGLARDLGIPLDPGRALDVIVTGAERRIDAGEIDGRLFFNVAGVGLDARVAHRFAVNGLVRRGFLKYAEMTLRELMTYHPDEHTIRVDDDTIRERATVIAIANSRQYGNGAIVAPRARLDDGALDVVIVADRPLVVALLELPKLFTGGITSLRGVTARQARNVEITSASTVVYHADGEPFVGGASIRAACHPAALSVRVPTHA